jgi:hypothetical protein
MPSEVVSGTEPGAQAQKEYERTLTLHAWKADEFALSGSGLTDPSSYDCALRGCMEVKLSVDRRGNFDRESRLNLTTQSCAVRRPKPVGGAMESRVYRRLRLLKTSYTHIIEEPDRMVAKV